MTVKVLIIEDNPVARSFLCRVVRESFSDAMEITEVGDLENARRQVAKFGGTGADSGTSCGRLFLVRLAGNVMVARSTSTSSQRKSPISLRRRPVRRSS